MLSGEIPRRRSCAVHGLSCPSLTRQNIDDLFKQAALEPDEAKRTAIYKKISGNLNKIVDKVSWWTLNAMSFKSKKLSGVLVPKNTREFIIGVQNWTLTQ